MSNSSEDVPLLVFYSHSLKFVSLRHPSVVVIIHNVIQIKLQLTPQYAHIASF